MSKKDVEWYNDPETAALIDKTAKELRELRGIPAVKNESVKTDEDKGRKKRSKKPFLGGYPIGESEFMVLVHFFWLTSFFILFLFVRMLVLISGV